MRAELRDEDGRTSLIEAELVPAGRNRVQVNRQRLAGPATCSAWCGSRVFSPDDLTLVKGGPADRRRFMDDTLVALAVKYDALRLELDRIVRQRNMLLRQAGGRLDESAAITLDVWDARLADVGRPLRPRPPHARRAAAPDGGRGLRPAGRRADGDRRALRPGVARRRAGLGARPGPRTPT